MTRKFLTRAIHDGEGPDTKTGAHNTPIYQTATFSFESAEEFAEAIEIAVDPDRTNPPDTTFLFAHIQSNQRCIWSKNSRRSREQKRPW